MRLHGLCGTAERLRDTLLLFEKLYGDRLKGFLATLTETQTLLGEIQDLATIKRMALGGKDGAGDAQLLEAIEQESAAKSQLFRDHWKRNFGSERSHGRWTAFVGQFEDPPADTAVRRQGQR